MPVKQAELINRLVKGSKLVVLPGIGHCTILLQLEEIIKALRAEEEHPGVVPWV